MVRYYLQDKSYFHGSYMNWWAKDSKGYTANLDNAHQFTADEIAEMQSRGMRPTDIPWLCSYIDDKSARCVSSVFCNYDEMKEQESILLSRSDNNGWISIKTQGLPKENGKYLVYNYADDDVWTANFDNYYGFNNHHEKVTHYQKIEFPNLGERKCQIKKQSKKSHWQMALN